MQCYISIQIGTSTSRSKIIRYGTCLRDTKIILTDEAMSEILSFQFPSDQLEARPVNTIRKRKDDSVSIIQSLPLETVPAL